MGKYINYLKGKHIGTTSDEKCKSLIEFGALEIPKPKKFIPNVLVCVVDNYSFGAAAYCYNEGEFEVMTNETNRPTRWFHFTNVVDYAE